MLLDLLKSTKSQTFRRSTPLPMAGRLVKREAGGDLKGSEREEFIDFSFDVDGWLIVVDQQGFFEAECRGVTCTRDDLGFEGGAAVHSVLKHT